MTQFTLCQTIGIRYRHGYNVCIPFVQNKSLEIFKSSSNDLRKGRARLPASECFPGFGFVFISINAILFLNTSKTGQMVASEQDSTHLCFRYFAVRLPQSFNVICCKVTGNLNFLTPFSQLSISVLLFSLPMYFDLGEGRKDKVEGKREGEEIFCGFHIKILGWQKYNFLKNIN